MNLLRVDRRPASFQSGGVNLHGNLLAALVGLGFLSAPLSAQTPSAPGVSESAHSIQEQLDALKRGQDQILKELADLKHRLDDTVPKIEYGMRPQSTNLVRLNVRGEPFRGDAQAHVAVIEYSDFACSFCARYVREVFPKIRRDYLDTGKVKYYFRDLPAPEHPQAEFLARVTRCAGDQRKFWEMHDWLFAMQGSSESTNIAAQAAAVGLDLDGFQACLATGKYSENIRRSQATAQRAGVYGAPGFIVGSIADNSDVLTVTKVMVGAESADELRAALDELLASPTTEGEKQSRHP